MIKIACVSLVSGLVLSSTITRADTTADCGRFLLKLNPKSGQMECINKSRPNGALVRKIRKTQRAVRVLLRKANALLELRQPKPKDYHQAENLLSTVRKRVVEIRYLTKVLGKRQRQRQGKDQFERDLALAFDASNRVSGQRDQSLRLEQQQKDLIQQLISQQQQLMRSLQKRNKIRRKRQLP